MMLQRIIAHKRDEVAARRRRQPLSAVRAAAESRRAADPLRGFQRALHRSASWPALIAEIKRASPSKGLIRADFAPARLAADYAAGGAACLSVLTDEAFFQGSDDYLRQARAACPLPALRKDFTVDAYQVYEAFALGADAVLLIVAALDPGLLRELYAVADGLGLDVLVEVHDERELEQALALGAPLIGINNRDLRTFETTLAVTERLASLVPPDRLLVSESGIFTRGDCDRVEAAGAGAVLVGESLMRQPDVAAAARTLLGPAAPQPRPWVKICGHRRPDSVRAAARAGVDAVGFVFAPSPRQVTPATARHLGEWLPPDVERIGVFVDASVDELLAVVDAAALTGVQLCGQRETAADCKAIAAARPHLHIIRALKPRDRADLAVVNDYPPNVTLLLDTPDPHLAGGTGRPGDWTLTAEAVSRWPDRRFVLAGGLSPGNVRRAQITAGMPWGVDVSSGVESGGVKQPALIQQFALAAQARPLAGAATASGAGGRE